MCKGPRRVTQRHASAVREQHTLGSKSMPRYRVSSRPGDRRDIRAVSNPRDDSVSPRFRQIAVAIAVLNRLPAQKQAIGVQGEEFVHAPTVNEFCSHATGEIHCLWIDAARAPLVDARWARYHGGHGLLLGQSNHFL